MTNLELKESNNTNIRSKTQPKSITKGAVADSLDNIIDYVDQEIDNIADSIPDASKEDKSNKSTDVVTDGASDIKYPSVKSVKTYADGLVVGLLDDRGNYNASVNTFPATGGSGVAGAILKGDLWFISVAGTLGGVLVPVGASVRALVNTPGQTSANWNVLNVGLGFTPENVVNKSTNLTTDGASDTKYPSVKAVKTYVDANVGGTSVVKSVKVTLTPLQVQSLFTTPIKVIDCAVGKAVLPIQMLNVADNPTAGYFPSGGNIALRYENLGTNILTGPTTLGNFGEGEAYAISVTSTSSGGFSRDGEDVYVRLLTADPVGGDGGLVVYIIYSEITL